MSFSHTSRVALSGLIGLLSAGVLAADAAPPQGSYLFDITYLGTLGGLYSFANGIDDSGAVTGYSSVAGETADYAFVYKDGAMQSLGSLGGTSSAAYASNAAGQIVGYSYTTDDAEIHAFLFAHGVMQDMGASQGPASYAYSINRAGTATGCGDGAFVYAWGQVSSLGLLGCAQAVNLYGTVAGYAALPSGQHAFVLTSSGRLIDVGTPEGFDQTYGYGLSSSNHLTGEAYSSVSGKYKAFLWAAGAMKVIGPITQLYDGNSFGWGIDDADDVVGHSYVNRNDSVAFLYAGGRTMNLNSLISAKSPLKPFVTLTDATGINHSCWIVADGTDNRTGATGAYLLRPLGSRNSKDAPCVNIRN